VSVEAAPSALHDLFWHSELNPPPGEAVKWRRRLENGIETIMRMRGGAPAEAAQEAFRGVVVAYSNETFPRNCDPHRCAHCRTAEDPSAPLIPLGVGPHAWLHSDCWVAWREGRRETAVAQLAAMGIVSP
jgi:hypothetical protein